MSTPAPTLGTTIFALCRAVEGIPPTDTRRNARPMMMVAVNVLEEIRHYGNCLRVLADQCILDNVTPQPSQPATPSPQLTELSTKLDTISDMLEALPASSPSQTTPESYAAAVRSAGNAPRDNSATGPATSAPRDVSLDIVLVPNQDTPRTPSTHTQTSLRLAIMRRFGEHAKLRQLLSFHSVNNPVIRAIIIHTDNTIRIIVYNEEQRDILLARPDSWVPHILPTHRLSHAPHGRGHTIVVHGVPTSFTVQRSSVDVARLITQNKHVLTSPATLVNSHWLGHQSIDKLRSAKSHSSIVLHVRSREMADQLVTSRISIDGILLRTEHITLRPSQCYNCFELGHIASHCHRPPVCGVCAGPHRTTMCACPHSASPCTDLLECPHIVKKCAVCSGPHWASDRDCPVRQ